MPKKWLRAININYQPEYLYIFKVYMKRKIFLLYMKVYDLPYPNM